MDWTSAAVGAVIGAASWGALAPWATRKLLRKLGEKDACRMCGGVGKIWEKRGQFDCPRCKGTGAGWT